MSNLRLESMKKVILASVSPRRYEILKKHGIEPTVLPSDADEMLPPCMEDCGVAEIVSYLAHVKASAVYDSIQASNCDDTVILGADTVVYKDGVIGKPVDEADAFRILSLLRASSHSVFTGVSLIDLATGTETRFVDETKVHFKNYPDSEIYRFIREEPPYDKSGSYAIQSSWTKNVDRIEGDLENVIGLPWYRLEPLLRIV
jgi:septum formation protein